MADDEKFNFYQHFNKGSSPSDIITTLQFNDDGELLAVGDKGGEVTIYQKDPSFTNDVGSPQSHADYKFLTEFKSHESSLDPMTSYPVEAKVNKIRWLKRKSPSHCLLSTNDKTVKLFKLSKNEGYGSMEMMGKTLIIKASPRRIFGNAHIEEKINDISVNSDQETFLSAGDSHINVWHLEVHKECFNVVNMEPQKKETITTSQFHPTECNLFAYSSTKGIIRLCDMRQAALCDNNAKMFQDTANTYQSSLWNLFRSIHDMKFSNSGRYMLSRNSPFAKVWDFRMETNPVETYSVLTLRPDLSRPCCSFSDQFKCCWSRTDRHIMTGSYNEWKIFDRNSKEDYSLTASQESIEDPGVHKILYMAWHPYENIIATAANSNLYFL